MKMNWGHGITIVMIGFVSFMGYLAFRCFQTPSFLVREDYYQASLNTDEIIAATQRGHAIGRISAMVQGDSLVIMGLMPHSDVNTLVEISAYFPSNPALDWHWSGVPSFNSSGHFSLPHSASRNSNPSGKYQIAWVHDSQPCIQSIEKESN